MIPAGRLRKTLLRHLSSKVSTGFNNPHVVMHAVMQNGWALDYASVALKNYLDAVTSAVKQNGLALDNASEV